MTAVNAELKPWNVQQAQWEQRVATKKEALRVEYIRKGLQLQGSAPVMAPAGVQATMAEVEDWLKEALDVEWKLFKVMRSNFKAGQFGDPLSGEDNLLRHAFWPSVAKRLPLLNFCAEVMLGGAAAATENERFHSLVAYIMNKLRARLTVETLERLALNKHFLVKRLRAAFEAAKTAEAMVEACEEYLEFE